MITLEEARRLPPEKKQVLLGKVQNVLARDRKNLDAILSGAALFETSGSPLQAIELLKRAAKLRPTNPLIFQWLAMTSSDARLYEEANRASRRLVELAPDSAENWQVRGQILDNIGDPQNALAAFRQKAALEGEVAETVFQIANCHVYLGELDKAEAGYRRVIELEPDHALALYGLSTIYRFNDDEVTDYVEDVEKAVKCNVDSPAYYIAALYYGAGKALDDVKDYDRAFDYYRKANEAMNPEKVTDFHRPFEDNKAAFTSQLVSDKQKWGDQSRRPIFILGLPRSGTTLVESLIAAHPKVTSGGELPVMEDIAYQVGAHHQSADEFRNHLASIDRKTVAGLSHQYIKGVRAICGRDNLVTDKMPHNFMLIGLILMLFPNAKIFHCRRNPLDICTSIYTNGMTPAHNAYKTDLKVLGEYYRHYIDLMEFWHRQFPGKIIDIYYEDVVANTEINARKMIGHIGLKWDERVLTRKSDSDSFKTLSAYQVRQPIYQSAKGKWKRFESHLEPLVDALGDAVPDYQVELSRLAEIKEN